MLSSNSNRQIKELIKLQNQAKYRKKSGMFVAEGAKLVAEAAHYGKLQKIYIAESSQGREEERIQPLLEEFPYEVVSEEVFAEITDTVTPQGVLGLVQMPKYTMEEILNANNQQFLLLDDLRDPGNLGTIMRTAEGAGMAAVLMSKGTVDLFNAESSPCDNGSHLSNAVLLCGRSAGALQKNCESRGSQYMEQPWKAALCMMNRIIPRGRLW